MALGVDAAAVDGVYQVALVALKELGSRCVLHVAS
jgi:hypothetical protein